MTVKTSRRGVLTGAGLPYALNSALVVAVGQQAKFTHYNNLVMLSAQGEVNLADGTAPTIGSIVDVSPKGDSCTVETEGFEWVVTSETCVAGDLVTADSAHPGQLKKLPALSSPTSLAELSARAAYCIAGIYQVDEYQVVGSVKQVLVNLDAC